MDSVDEPVVLDTDVLSEITRRKPSENAWAAVYLERHGRFTVTAITVYERLRGYHAAIRQGKPFVDGLEKFEKAVASFLILPFDAAAAAVAAQIWAGLSNARRRAREDILIAAVAASRGLPLATRNRQDYQPMTAVAVELVVTDWS